MKRLLALAFLLSTSSAWAQNPTCPTRPPGDTSNACASTAFVQNAVGGSVPLTHTHIFVGNGSNIAANYGTLATFSDTGTLSLNPTTGFSLGYNLTQTLSGSTPPSQTGTFLGYAANRILVNNNSSYSSSIFGLHVELDTTLAGSGPGNAAGFFHTISGAASGSSGFAIGTTHYVSVETNWLGGTLGAPNGAVYGLSVYSRMGGAPIIHLLNLTGMEINPEAGGNVSSTIDYKSGIQIALLQNDSHQGISFDAAVSISNIAGSTTLGWRDGILFSAANGQQPMEAANGTLIKTRGAGTVLNGIDLSSYTITASAYKSVNFNVDGSGLVSGFRFNNMTITTPVSPSTLTIASAKTFTASNTMILTAIDGSTIVFGSGGTVLYGNQTITLSGDVTGSGATSIATTLATVNANVGSFGSSTAIPNFTVNGKGLITAAGTNAVIAPAGTLTGATLAANVLASSLTSVGTLTGGATGAGFTIALTTSTVTGTLPCANTPAYTGQVTKSSGSCATVIATAQPDVHTWALAQTFTVAPVFTDQSGSRTALGLGTIATQAASSVAITGGTIAGLTGLAIRDTSAAFDVTIAATSSGVLSAGRTLTLNMGNVAHTLAFGTTANTITFPNVASDTVGMLATTQTWTLVNTYLENTRYSMTATGAGFWLASKVATVATADRFFFGSDASANDTFRIFSALSGGNSLQFASNATATLGVWTLQGTLVISGLVNGATTSSVCYNTGTGAVTYNGTVGTCTVSDESLKNIEGRIEGALDKLLRINGIRFTWRDNAYGSGEQIGVGAQTVEAVFPELVQTDSLGHKSADYQRLTAPIIEALRELKGDNDNLREEIKQLSRSR